MPSPEIEEFAKLLVQQVRDAAIRACDRSLRVDAMHPVAKRWRELSGDQGLQSVARVLIPDIVDCTVAELLRAIDQGVLQTSITVSDGKIVDLTVDGLGELCGWYMGSGGWRARYSEERFIDDFSDVR